MTGQKYFLPYQNNWLKDESRIKIWEKSRRIGATYVQSYEDVRDCLTKKVPAVYFSSADITAAREYINYCAKWARLFQKAGEEVGEIVVDDKEINTYKIRFKNNTAIYAMSSNPKNFRSKGGKVVLDEFAFHEDPVEMWRAARPVITWGFPLRILSTHNGKSCLYYDFVEKAKKGELSWTLHTVDIYRAADEGLVDKIYGRKTTPLERSAWLEEERKSCNDALTWAQEYECKAIDEAAAFFTYELLDKIKVKGALISSLSEIKGDFYVGVDVARKHDLTVIWLLEKEENKRITRKVIRLKDIPFSEQERRIEELLSHPQMRRCCIDSTGLGMQLAENLQLKHGKTRVESIFFTARVKEDLAYHLYHTAQDGNLSIPDDQIILEDFHNIRKTVTSSGNIRFDAVRTDRGHSDHFWACALAAHAIGTNKGVPFVCSNRKHRKKKESLLRGY